ncbi:MAG: LppX_LprAFG lipoprotein, partial [Chloroflexota bacterium]|nr:LppX_LprAFG lipoprotein [Chloroflexota bacterium]
GAVAPAQAYQNLQARDNRRETWQFSGIAISGVSGDFTVTYDFNGGNQRMVAQSGGNTVLEAYRIGGQLFTRNPLGGGYIATDASNPLSQPVQQLFELPRTILTNLIPPDAKYTAAGIETVNGRAATRYTGNVNFANLGVLNPSLQGQSGTSVTTIWVANEGGYIVATEANVQASAGGTANATRARLDVTEVGTVPAISVP